MPDHEQKARYVALHSISTPSKTGHAMHLPGTILDRDQLPEEPHLFDRLLGLGAIREAAPHERSMEQVQLPEGPVGTPSTEARMAEVEREAAYLRSQLAERDHELTRLRAADRRVDLPPEAARKMEAPPAVADRRVDVPPEAMDRGKVRGR